MESITITEENGDVSEFLIFNNILDEEDYLNLKYWLETREYHIGDYKNKDRFNRSQLWYQKDNKYFCPEWRSRYKRWESNDYDELLLDIQNKVINKINKLSGKTIMEIEDCNSCLVNYYKDGGDFIPQHKDTRISFGEEPTIIGLSIGESRKLKIVKDNNESSFEIDMCDNSVFVMSGCSQKYFTHGIDRDESKINPRWSMTFRKFIL